MTERWLPVVGWEDLYEVSDLGRVRRDGHVLACRGVKYPMLGLSRNGKVTSRTVHTLVLEAFVGPCPLGLEALHANDIPTDNRLTNLSWGTRTQNMHDQVRNGRHVGANRTHCRNCGEELVWYRTQRLCMSCLRKSQRKWARRNRQQQKETT